MSPTSAEELRLLLEEISRRPHLARDPRVVALIEIARRKLPSDGDERPGNLPRRVSRRLAVAMRTLRRLPWRAVAWIALDIGVVVASVVVAPGILFQGTQVFSLWSMVPLASVWLLIRSEALRLLLMEAGAWIGRAGWLGVLWVAEEFSRAMRARWLEAVAVSRLVREWRKRRGGERSFEGLLAFLQERLDLDPRAMGRLGDLPDRGSVPGLLGRLANPALRWPGDPRLLPSSVRWTMTQALRLSGSGQSAGAARVEHPSPPTPEPDRASSDDDEERRKELNQLNSKIKSLREEIDKIQKWSISNREEERLQSAAIKEKLQELKELRERASKLGAFSGGTKI